MPKIIKSGISSTSVNLSEIAKEQRSNHHMQDYFKTKEFTKSNNFLNKEIHSWSQQLKSVFSRQNSSLKLSIVRELKHHIMVLKENKNVELTNTRLCSTILDALKIKPGTIRDGYSKQILDICEECDTILANKRNDENTIFKFMKDRNIHLIDPEDKPEKNKIHITPGGVVPKYQSVDDKKIDEDDLSSESSDSSVSDPDPKTWYVINDNGVETIVIDCDVDSKPRQEQKENPTWVENNIDNMRNHNRFDTIVIENLPDLPEENRN